MRRWILLVLVVACRSPEREAAPIVVASASVAPVVSVIPSATSVASTTSDDAGPIVVVDAGKREKDDNAQARERARLVRELSAQQLQMLAVLGSSSDAGTPASVLSRGDIPPIDLSSVAASPRDAGGGGAGLNVGGGGGRAARGGLSDLSTLRDH